MVLEQERQSYQRNRETHLRCSAAYQKTAAGKAYHAQYWKEHPDKAREYQSRRRAAKRAAGGDHSAEDIADIRKMQRDRCANPTCRCKLTGKGSIDHIRALVNGGTNDRRNLQLLCKSCNSRKRKRDAITFMQEQGLLL